MAPKKKKSSDGGKLTVKSSMIFEMELELSKMKREKSIIVLNKAIFLYFFFIFLAVISLLTGFKSFFDLLVVMGLLTIIIGSVPYIRTMYVEEQNLKEMIARLKKYA
ncbi:MAG: hypothetical protein ACOCUR_00330 [Nanoarchaeota archaeon]